MAAELLRRYPDRIAQLTLTPGSGGVFDVRVDDRLLFSKHQAGRHAEPGEIERLFELAIAANS